MGNVTAVPGGLNAEADMYDLAEPVRRWLDAGAMPRLVLLVRATGFSSVDPVAALAVVPGAPPAGRLLQGAAEQRLVEWLETVEDGLREFSIADEQAGEVGLSCGGTALLLVVAASSLDGRLWPLLSEGQPCCLVTEIRGGRITRSSLHTPDTLTVNHHADVLGRLVARGTSASTVVEDGEGQQVLIAFWPTPRLIVAGDGLIADALASVAALLGWYVSTVDAAATAAADLPSARRGDAVIVLSHDLEFSGRALQQALGGPASYVGALGSRRTQQRRRDWLAEHGMSTDTITQIRGPAGLDIGALSPAEIAVSILAEVLSVRSGTPAVPLSQRDGAIHRNGPNAAPPRYPVY
ncbi:XdhC family protein [Jatrophihabitans telluris]|uniref:XdhC family protein n=1 Tax=Jatrophihabitans telluris TaxID=2038343 RepID=A0ABY4R1J1_9ACTN|nr:XdhC family protein [Jatrophihabitans telluris]UQX89660.1 XdhC family protein [Jatrophihabitans telluris]